MSLNGFVIVFLLVVGILYNLALLWLLEWFPLRLSSKGGAKRTILHRGLQPRTPDGCPCIGYFLRKSTKVL